MQALIVTVVATLCLVISGYNLFKTYQELKRRKRNTVVVLSQLREPVEETSSVYTFKDNNKKLQQVVAEMERKLAKGA